MLVRATGASKTLKVKIKELGRIAKEGETFEVTSQRFTVLNGNNRFHAKFVVKAVSDGDFDYNTVKIKKDEPKKVNQDPFFKEDIKVAPKVEAPKKKLVKSSKVTEEPEIWIIEPGKEAVQVDKNLNPIEPEVVEEEPVVEEPVVEETPKKKSGRPKKTVEVVDVDKIEEEQTAKLDATEDNTTPIEE